MRFSSTFDNVSMASASTSCPRQAACPQSEQPSAASGLDVAASVDAMSIDNEAVADVGLASTRASVVAGDVLQSIDANAGALF